MSGAPGPQRMLEPASSFFASVEEQLGEVLRVGLDVQPAGGISADWRALLARLSVEPLGEEVRFAAARSDGMTRGAPFAEAEACLEAVTARALQACRSGAAELPDLQREQLTRVIAALRQQALELYRSRACARAAGLFAHAKHDASLHRWSGGTGGSGYVLHCPSCGAPRMRSDLTCAFCGGQIGR